MLAVGLSRGVDLGQCRLPIRHSRVTGAGRAGRCAGVRARAHNKRGAMMDLGDIVVGVFVAVLGLVGLVLASGALDQEIYLFGLSLFGFAVVFDWGLMVKGLRRAEAARARSRSHE
jgi:hypothetical protein